jgi:uncharacterized protein (TIGR03083 family)
MAMADVEALIVEERRALAQDLAGLTDAQWQTPSALKGWKVRHVAGHIVFSLENGMMAMMGAFLRNGFNFNRTMDFLADNEKRAPAAVGEALKAQATNNKFPPGIGAVGMLMDLIVHSLDVRVPLGIVRPYPKDAAIISLKRLTNPRTAKMFGTPTGFTVAATDVDFTTGTGPRVEGTANTLLHALSGRSGALKDLAGDGAPAFRERFKEYG